VSTAIRQCIGIERDEQRCSALITAPASRCSFHNRQRAGNPKSVGERPKAPRGFNLNHELQTMTRNRRQDNRRDGAA
jgi:hypothetical protein